jgi:two-component system, LuxR family, response regulator FixJ
MQSKGSPVRIVYIVDDDAALLGSLERTFRAAGLTAVSYHTAFAFLDAAPDLSDGCLLLDIVMPEMDGLELQERLNSLGFNMPVIAMTAWGDVETAVQAMKSGAVDFIEKPFNAKRFSMPSTPHWRWTGVRPVIGKAWSPPS